MKKRYTTQLNNCISAVYGNASGKLTKMRRTLLFSLVFLLTFNVYALDIHLIKAPSDGPEEMKKYTIIRAHDSSGYVIAGTTPSDPSGFFGGAMVINIMKIDDFGAVQWSYYYGLNGFGFEATHIDYSVIADRYVVCGFTNYNIPFGGPLQSRGFLLEVDDLGAQTQNQFMHVYGAFTKIKPTPSNNYIAIGFINGDTMLQNIKTAACVKFDASFTLQWVHTYEGVYNTLLPYVNPLNHYEGIQGVSVVFDGFNETYVLGGNFTDSFGKSVGFSILNYLIPIIDMRELDANGNIITQFHEKATLSATRSIDIIVQDVLVIDNPSSPFHGDIIMAGQEFNYSESDPSNSLILARFNRNPPIVRATDYLRFKGLINNFNHAGSNFYDTLRGNTLQYFESIGDDGTLVLFGSLERTDRQVPMMMTFEPDIRATTTYNILYITEITPIIEAKYQGNRNLFTDHFGTGSRNQDITINYIAEQYYPHSLGHAFLNNHNDITWGMVNIRKVTGLHPDYSLFVTSNTTSAFCFYDEDTVEYERSYNTFNNFYTQSSQTFQLPSSTYTVDDMAANFQDTLCNSAFLVWSSSKEILLNQKNLNIYPNPTLDIINIDGAKTGDNIEILDLQGRKVINTTFQEKQSISLTQLNSGIYLLKVIRNSEAIFINKLQKY